MLKRPSNKPRDEIQRLAADAIANNGGPQLSRVYYKFDCAQCGSRETVPEPNSLPATGTCTVCGHVTTIIGAGYALHTRRDAQTPWLSGPVLFVRKHYESDKGDA